jgi:hypothetical protein
MLQLKSRRNQARRRRSAPLTPTDRTPVRLADVLYTVLARTLAAQIARHTRSFTRGSTENSALRPEISLRSETSQWRKIDR